MSNNHYEMTVFGKEYKLIAIESNSNSLMFRAEDNSELPPIYSEHTKLNLRLRIKMPNGFYKSATVTRAPYGMFAVSFI
ncbi:hypothetical protein I5F07_03150 [Proteus vulgaris]|uniref:hypothetical protein n=1 Tax=Proteus TaxID=583 RepID=UPI0018A0C0A2|nr:MULTISPECIES: hypothetical protein [Morganellaceae]MBG5983865.1 hypothetical protein [Proteus vulgaris]QPE15770.1 hypothetical protein IMQ36_11185 [Providencia rettgeri]